MEKVESLNAVGYGLFNGFFRFDPRGAKKCPESIEQVGIFRLGYLVGYLFKLALVIYFGPQVVGVAQA